MLDMTNGFPVLVKWAFITAACASLSAALSQSLGEFRDTACHLGMATAVLTVAMFHARVERSVETSPLFDWYVRVVSVFAIVQILGFLPITSIVAGPTIMVGAGWLDVFERPVTTSSGPISGFVLSALVTYAVAGTWMLLLIGLAAILRAIGWARVDARRAIRERARGRVEGRP